MSHQIPCQDHLGNTFSSVSEMCDHYDIPVKTFESRIRLYHWSLENALTAPIGKKRNCNVYTDHKGNTFNSMQDMADYWNMPVSTLQARLANKNLSIEEVLTNSTDDMYASRKCTDHLGNIFPSKTKMCQHYNIASHTFFGRMQMGWSLEDALTKPLDYQPKNSKQVIDHLGQTFTSESALCKHWNISRSTYRARLDSGWSIEKTLTTPCKNINIKKKACVDHLGNEFASQNAMCKHYNISHHLLHSRLNDLGWDLERALTEPTIINNKSCYDFAGNEFPTLRDMAHYYNIPAYRLQGNNVTPKYLQKLITRQYKPNTQVYDITIKKLIEFPYFLVIHNDQEVIYHFNKIMETYHNHDFYPIPDRKINLPNLKIINCIDFPRYDIIFNDKHSTWTYWEIINYIKDMNFGLSPGQTSTERN